MTLDPNLLMKVAELAIFFVAGVITWSLALYRYLAMEKRRVNLLTGLVLIEECSVLFISVWLASHTDYAGAAAMAAGGAMASRFVMKRADGNGSSTN